MNIQDKYLTFVKKNLFHLYFSPILSQRKFTAPKTVSRPYTGIEPERRADILVIRPKLFFLYKNKKISVAIHLVATRFVFDVVNDDVRVFMVSFCKLMFMDWDMCVFGCENHVVKVNVHSIDRSNDQAAKQNYWIRSFHFADNCLLINTAQGTYIIIAGAVIFSVRNN